MRTSVIIYRRGSHYAADVKGRFGGGFLGCIAGDTAEEAANFGARQMMRYGQSNPDGGDLIAPSEVADLVPHHLRSLA